jgi:nitric oxide reductase activation protein
MVAAAGSAPDRRHRRIIDIEKEAIVLMMDALEGIGDRYGIYGFSGHGRDNVEFYIIKGLDEEFSPEIAKRLGRVSPLHATRMGPAIRHTTAKLRQEATRSKFLFLISDGRPQDRGYSQEDSEKLYAVQDTRAAFAEARREGIQPFCLTVDKEGNDYLRVMMDDFSYEVLADVTLLPERLPQLYRKLTR